MEKTKFRDMCLDQEFSDWYITRLIIKLTLISAQPIKTLLEYSTIAQQIRPGIIKRINYQIKNL